MNNESAESSSAKPDRNLIKLICRSLYFSGPECASVTRYVAGLTTTERQAIEKFLTVLDITYQASLKRARLRL